MTPRKRDPFNPDFSDLEYQLGSLKAQESYYEDYEAQAELERQQQMELYPTAKGIPNLIIGGKTVPIDRFPCHFGLQGVTRSGKSHQMNILIKSIFDAYTAKIYRSKNIVILDSKNDYIPWVRPLAAENNIDLRIIKFGSPESYCLDIAALVGGDPIRAMNLAKTLLPTPTNGQVFWSLLGQGLITSTILALVAKYGDCWGFHDLYDTVLLSLGEFYKLVGSTPEGKAFVSRYFPDGEGNENVKYGVLAEFSSTIANLRPAAELQRHTPKARWITARDFIPDNLDTCTIISSTPGTDAALRPLVQFMFSILTEEIAALPEGYNKYISLVIDELPFWGKLPLLEKNLQFNPSKGLRAIISWQDYSNVEYFYTPALARAITGNMAVQLYLHPASPSSAEYAIASLGKRRVTEQNISYSASGINISENQVVRTPLETGDLYDLPLADPNDGIYFVMNAPTNFNGITKNRMDARTVDMLIPKARKQGGGLLRKLFGGGQNHNIVSLTTAYTKPIGEQARYLAVRGMVDLLDDLNSEKAYQDYMSVCTNDLDRFMAEKVWQSMQQSVEILTRRILKK